VLLTRRMQAAPLATTFASSLAWLILRLGAGSPIAPWRLLFLIEGFPSVLIAAVAWSAIPDTPSSASYLTARERQVARLRLRRGKRQLGSKGNAARRPSEGLKYRDVLSAFADPKAWITAVMFFLTNMAYSSLPVFLPTILREMNHTALESQALSAPPYLIAFISVLVTAHLSDKLQSRTWFVVFHAFASLTGYTMLALAKTLHLSNMWRYIAIYPAAIGFFNVVVLTIAWNINNQPSESKQGGGFVLFQVIGQCGPLVGTRLYPKSDAPFFEKGMWTCAGAMFGVAVLAVCLRFLLVRLNRRLERESNDYDGEEGQGLVGGGRHKRVEDEDRRFRYIL
jgi:sugar phosphate permease